MHESAVVHVLEAHRHVDEDVAHELVQHFVAARLQQLQVRAFDIFHEQVRGAFDLPMLDLRSKSINRTLPLRLTITFSGLKSKCMNPLSCTCSRPTAMSMRMLPTNWSSTSSPRACSSFRFEPSTYSMSR